MTTKVEKVVLEKTVYVAFDGMEFDDEETCESYEMKLYLDDFMMRDPNLRPTSDIGLATYVKLDTPDLVLKFMAVCDYFEVTTHGLNVDMPGVYYYSMAGRVDEWVNLNTVLCAT